MQEIRIKWVSVLLLWLLIGCGGMVEDSAENITIDRTSTNQQAECLISFGLHYLDHTTTNQYEPVDMYDSNGSGLALNDLDNDGDIDIVLANLADNNAIFWNEGTLTFRKQELDHGNSRAVAVVDVDADSLLDIVFTTRVGTLIVWRNQGDGQFTQGLLEGVNEKAYTMAWGDLDNDGDLDLVTGSYDTALEKELRDSFMFGPGAGVFVFTNQGNGTFTSERLAETSQVLAIQLLDVNADGRDDIIVGNDFASVRDFMWVQTDDGWERAEPFAATTENTMSFDLGDVDNDGSAELFAADMKPYSPANEADHMPLMEAMMANHTVVEGDPQVMANVLQMRDDEGGFVESAESMGLDGTGWSWSTKFGDLDNDGYLDLYSVNGMISFESLSYLPNNELVEENQALRNDGYGMFTPIPRWGLNHTASGRGMSMADLDNDGDLDIVVNNLLDRAYLLENRLCEGGSVQVELRQPDTANPFAIGAVVTLDTSLGEMTRDVRVISGYLSGDPTRLHFGVPADAKIDGLTIEWPDGDTAEIKTIKTNQIITVTRN